MTKIDQQSVIGSNDYQAPFQFAPRGITIGQLDRKQSLGGAFAD